MRLEAERLFEHSRRADTITHSDQTVWRGAGSRVRAELPKGISYLSTYLIKQENVQEGKVSPVVVRVIDDLTPFEVVDYVMYSDHKDGTGVMIETHYLPKWIEDPQELFRGEPPVPEEYVGPLGVEIVDALAKVSVAEPNETVIIFGRREGDYVFTAEAATPLDNAGTLPFYPNIDRR